MRYTILESFKVRTSTGDMELSKGQTIELRDDQASGLLAAKKIKAHVVDPHADVNMQRLAEVLQYEGPITHKAFVWTLGDYGYSAVAAEQLIKAGTGIYWTAEPGQTGKHVYRPLLNVRISSDSVPTREANNGKQ